MSQIVNKKRNLRNSQKHTDRPSTLSDAQTHTSPHPDWHYGVCRYFGVWLIFFMLGLGTLLPWNFFMTATTVWTRFRFSVIQLQPDRLKLCSELLECKHKHDGVALCWLLQYFTSRLKDSSSSDLLVNQTEAAGQRRTVLEAIFNNVMTMCAMLPLLLCTCLNSFLHSL